MKTLYLLRHAKAEPAGKETDDRERALSERGRDACAAIGAYMKAKKYHPDFALASPSRRTRQTLELVTRAAGIEPPCRFENALYLATGGEILQAVHGLKEGISAALLVGHNPGMHHASLLLCEARRTGLRTALELKYPTCALAVLRFDGRHWRDIAPGEGTLVDFVTPAEL